MRMINISKPSDGDAYLLAEDCLGCICPSIEYPDEIIEKVGSMLLVDITSNRLIIREFSEN